MTILIMVGIPIMDPLPNYVPIYNSPTFHFRTKEYFKAKDANRQLYVIHTPSIPLITSKKLPIEGLTIFVVIMPTTHAFKNE